EPNTLEPESVTFDKKSRYAFVTLQENNGVVRLSLRTKAVTYFGLGTTSHLADLTVGGGYSPTQSYTSMREPDGLFVFGRNGRYVVTADEGDSRNAAGSSGPRGG
ncbi:MAG: YncE family protein, partial [Actinomycetota bacterium]